MGSDAAAVVKLIACVLITGLLQMETCTAATRCSSVAKCASNKCCSKSGYCGTTSYECGDDCQSGPCWYYKKDHMDLPEPSESPASAKNMSLAHLVTAEFFDNVFPSRNEFYTYESFMAAASAFPAFGATGNPAARKKDVAAFLAHVLHETAGLTVLEETDDSSADDFCCSASCLENVTAKPFACYPGKKYFARGPLKLTWNYNYGTASQALGFDLLEEPEMLSKDPELAFKSALWLWMTPAAESKPSSHAVMTGSWSPSASDIAANRLPGFGATINILAGSNECGHLSPAADARTKDYIHIAKMLHVRAGAHLDCARMLPF